MPVSIRAKAAATSPGMIGQEQQIAAAGASASIRQAVGAEPDSPTAGHGESERSG